MKLGLALTQEGKLLILEVDHIDFQNSTDFKKISETIDAEINQLS